MLEGKHALVTGGGSGIGLAIARALAGAGAAVTITGRRAEVLNAAGDLLHPQAMDVSDEGSVREGFDKAVAARGPVQVLIANAGLAEHATMPDISLETWRRTMGVNLDGAFLTIREALPPMLASGWGRVIAISSIAGVKGMKRCAPYVAAKHGMVGLIRALSADYAGQPLTFNALCPGYVETDVAERNIERVMAREGLTRGEATRFVHSANPHGRLIPPHSIAQAALWLCGPGSGNISGQAIQIAGGEF
ncbi:SDR family oxidoreductase [Salipiger thiooxidans]|uniref:SDR family NAD(P)-dependent oxidoreductase n=1 Tax=Salipiger thiooxidans TaxID=282683 RepID=UPI001A8FBD1B|nr:SDR family NAD(P)-dependent oxidoreductase [Salipiger thiooxidans]MBN8187734.1 SDR family oxidoreductase [Salipiger thiooxidans]